MVHRGDGTGCTWAVAKEVASWKQPGKCESMRWKEASGHGQSWGGTCTLLSTRVSLSMTFSTESEDVERRRKLSTLTLSGI